eukprot:COSAG02_NODE_15269_length_1187_cov_1.492647_1_plen_67_part_00
MANIPLLRNPLDVWRIKLRTVVTSQLEVQILKLARRLFIAEICVYLGEYAVEGFRGADRIGICLQP